MNERKVHEPMVTIRLPYSQATLLRWTLEEAVSTAPYGRPQRQVLHATVQALRRGIDRALCHWTHPVTKFAHRLLGWRPGAKGVCVDFRA